jgi:hypothetical protein
MPANGGDFILETPGGNKLPFKTDIAARSYVMDHKLHRKFGRCFVEEAPGKFALMIADDRIIETESTEDDDEGN